MSVRTTGLAVLLAAAMCGCGTGDPARDDASTLPAATALPITVELDERWTEPLRSKPIAPVGSDQVRLRDGNHAVAGVRLVSTTLPIEVAFRLRDHRGGIADWCDIDTERDQLILAFPMGCVVTLRIVVPDRIACAGAADPSADALAAAILAKPTIGATDLGPVEGSPILPPGLFAEPVHGRIVLIDGMVRPFAGRVDDPDRCRIPLDAGPLELRGDSDSLLLVLDAPGGLVLLTVQTGGSDGPSGMAARNRGYGSSVRGGDALLYRHLLDGIGDIEFRDANLMP